MKDRFSREINYLRLSITENCNLRCKYCIGDDFSICKKETLSLGKIKNIVKAANNIGVKKIRLTGGEPLLREDLVDIISFIKSVNPDIEIGITTNGYLLLDKLDKLKNAGLDRLNISIDSLNENKYKKITKFGDLNRVLLAIKKAHEIGFKNIKINTVYIANFNDDEVEDFINFAKDNSLAVRFIELMPIGEARKLDASSFKSIQNIANNPRLHFFRNDGVAQIYQIDDSNGYIGLISPLSHKFCSACNRIRITSDGKIKPCLHSNRTIDIDDFDVSHIEGLLKKSILEKPAEHNLEKGLTDFDRHMNEIGG